MPLVEAARPGVLLEDPEAEAAWPQLLHLLEQDAPDAAAVSARVDVEVIEHVAGECSEAEDPGVAMLRDPDLVVDEHPLRDPPPRLVVRVDAGQIRHALASREVEVGQELGVAGSGGPDSHDA